MSTNLFEGQLVRRSSETPQVMGEAFARWNQNSEYFRLLDSDPAHYLVSQQIQGVSRKGS